RRAGGRTPAVGCRGVAPAPLGRAGGMAGPSALSGRRRGCLLVAAWAGWTPGTLMLAYWLLFLFPAVAALGTGTRFKRDRAGRAVMTPAWLLFGFVLVVMIGLRHKVGGDWYNYLGHLTLARGSTFGEVMMRSDPGYGVLNWLAAEVGF